MTPEDLAEGRRLYEAALENNRIRPDWGRWYFTHSVALLEAAERTQAAEARCAELEAEKREVIMCHLVNQTEFFELKDEIAALKAAARALLARLRNTAAGPWALTKALEELLT